MTPKEGSKICYLCGKEGADSRDHVPAKALLPPGGNEYQRITVPAHQSCNARESFDEEYVRDLIVPEAIYLGMHDAEVPYERVWKGWSRTAGWRRYQQFLRNARRLEVQSTSGVFVGHAMEVAPDIDRICRVGRKIVRGVLFNDTETVVADSDVIVVLLRTEDVPKIRQQDSDQPYWQALSRPSAIHTTCANGVALRRIYFANATDNGVSVDGMFAIEIWGCYIVGTVTFLMETSGRKDFPRVTETAKDD